MRCAWMVLRTQSRSSGVVAPRCLHVWLGMRSLRAVCRTERRAPQFLSDNEVFTIPPKKPKKRRRWAPTFSGFINLLDGVGKMIFGGWLELMEEDPYRHWHFGFVRSPGVTECLAIRWAIWERAAKAGWRLSEQQWDIVKAFDMPGTEQLFRDVTAPSASLRCRRFAGPLSAGSHAHQEGRLLDSNGGASGRQLASRFLPAKLRCCYSRVERAVGCATLGSSVLWYEKFQWGCLRLRSTSL